MEVANKDKGAIMARAMIRTMAVVVTIVATAVITM